MTRKDPRRLPLNWIFAFFGIVLLWFPPSDVCGQQATRSEAYTFKSGDPNGTGKWYMGREIAYVMGYQGMSWLDRPEREAEENTSILLKNMEIKPGEYLADIGAGSGYHVFKMAAMVPEGKVYAVDIQEEMLAELRRKQQQDGISNVSVIRGSEKNINLPDNSVDKVLMVDVYHEFSYPIEMVASIKSALKADGKIYLIEYRGEDPAVPIKETHKMTEAQAVKEMQAAGFTLDRNISNLPWQHCMVFVKE
jgi:SAM-dependent methyltransferase